ncbi:hypothetical protein BH11CYA1_BH11CYA1_37010 [soil metagenome]
MNNSTKGKKVNSSSVVAPLLATAIFALSTQSVQAQGFTDVLRNALGNSTNNSYSSNNYLAGNNNGLNAGQAASINNLNTTRAQANTDISTAVANGTLSVSQASLFQNQLNANANEQANYVNSGNFNFPQVQSVLTNLQGIHSSITSSISSGATNNFNNGTAVNTNNQYGWNNGRRHGSNRNYNGYNNQINTTYWTGIDSQLATSMNRIQEGLNNRSLTQYEYNDLRRQYDQIVAREAQFKASGGRFSNNERSTLERQIDTLNSNITREVTDRQNNRRGGYRWH